MKLPQELTDKYGREELLAPKRLLELNKKSNFHPSKESVSKDVKKIISKRANLDLKYFSDADILSKPLLEYTSRRFQALAVSLNRYLLIYRNDQTLSYAEVTKKDLTVEGLVKIIYDKILLS